MAAALAAAHRRGILHRDVKPQNILLDPDGAARLTDFGSAKLDGQLGITASGGLAGTLAYAAPEVLAGRRGDARADVYALGLTLYYALTGELPESPSRPSPAVARAPKAFGPRRVAPGCPAWLDDVIARATAAAAEDRFPTAAALDEALAATGAGARPLEAAPALRALRRPRSARARALSRLRRRAGRGGRHARLPPAGPPSAPSATRSRRASAHCCRPPRVPRDAPRGRGERPLFRVTPEGSARVLDALERRKLPARAIPASRAWTMIPGAYATMVLAVVDRRCGRGTRRRAAAALDHAGVRWAPAPRRGPKP